jgi:hypothetical protein
MKLRAETGSPPADDSYPLLLLQDQNQTNLAKWEASGSIDLIRNYLKNAGKITFQSEVAEQTQYSCMFEKDGDLYLAVNAWWDPEAEPPPGRWKRRDTSRTAYLMVVWAKHDVDPPAPNYPSGPMWYVCPPGEPDPISSVWQGLGGWLTGLLVTEDRNLVLGGANLEVDGYGNPPHGRFIHVALDKDAPASRTVIQRNASYYGANQWGPDAPDNPCAALGFLDDGSVHYWYHGPTGVPFYTADWVERMSLTAAGNLETSGTLSAVAASGPQTVRARSDDGAGILEARGDGASGEGRIQFRDGGTGVWRIRNVHSANRLAIYEDSALDADVIYWGTDGNTVVLHDLLVEGGDIGLTPDPDLLGLSANQLSVRGGVDVQGLSRCDSFRIDQSPTSGTFSATHYITISCNGANYRIPCAAA